jgi:peptidoglycan LD-endopeptidase LytH
MNFSSPNDSLADLLLRHRGEFAPVVDFGDAGRDVAALDLSAANKELTEFDPTDFEELGTYINKVLARQGVKIGAGGYNEERIYYQRSPLFASDLGPRTIHLGIDISVSPGTAVYAPLDARVHSFRNNAGFGDYGPTIILQHQLEQITFFSLYGHLSVESLAGKQPGQAINQGQEFAKTGRPEVNGRWYPHLHFQLIADMLGLDGDFPGVAAQSQRQYFLNLCPDPNLILGLQRAKFC